MAEKEYIERGAVLGKAGEEYHFDRGVFVYHDFVSVDDIKTIPAADVVEVVRCKDCKHSRPIDNTKSPEKYFKDDCVVCECWNVVGDEPTIYVPHHFCSYGERKEVTP